MNAARPAASSVKSAMTTRMSSTRSMSPTPSLYEPAILSLFSTAVVVSNRDNGCANNNSNNNMQMCSMGKKTFL